MNFKIKRLSFGMPIIISILIITILCIGIVKAISSINFTVFLKIAGEELQTDVHGKTNFLLLGSGGKNHEGSNLTDTIIVASLDNENKLITMLSIPRDLYVKDDVVGNSKINEVHYNAKNHFENSAQAMEYLKTKVEEIFGIQIQYWVKTNFDGFVDLVDGLGGIDINVEKAIYDPYYPKDGTYEYETFSIAKGQQHIDGRVALKYARSRETTSDFDRAKRQQQIIYAIKEKALQIGVFLNIEKIKSILVALKANIETNIKIKKILTLGSLADEYSEKSILHRLIHDDPMQCGGFLYTPMREYYNGQFVLLPAGGFNFLHMYADLNFNYPQIAKKNSKIHILNGTRKGGVAGETKQVLQRFCFEINRFGNGRSKDIAETTYYYKAQRPLTLDFLQKIIPGKESTIIPEEYNEYILGADIILEIGSDYTNSKNYLEDPFYYLPPAITTAPQATETSTSADTATNPEITTITTNNSTNAD